ncbi:MAG: hypothetical protein DWP97_05060 [Calditrichaeota bacterium]|nr:MAG: hypothetical protein DWP97_05060 [Calditrichota bacterium]
MNRYTFLLVTFLLLISTPCAFSEGTPQVVNYQGYVTDGGTPVNGNKTITFNIYDNSVGGALLWTSGPRVVSVTDGTFNYPLGSNNLLVPSVFSDTNRYLGITISPDPELAPRTKFTSVPYAFYAESAKSGGGWVDNGTVVELETPTDFVGIGRNYPINGNEVFGLHKTTTGYGGMNVNVSSSAGYPFYGYTTNGNFGAYHYYHGLTKSWNLYSNFGERFKIDSLGHAGLGIGSGTPVAFLEIEAGDTLAGYFTGTNDQANGTILHVEYTGPNTSNWDNTAIKGIANQNISSEFGIGGRFEGGYIGVIGTGYETGVIGTGMDDNGVSTGVRGTTVTTNFGTAYGVYAAGYGNTDAFVYGLYATAGGGATTGDRYAGYFSGNVHVNGTLSKSAGSFKIDHPLDPENKYLAHSFVESPDMMNVYNGNITTDQNGYAIVTLPEYFDALNKDFRYQLTTIGAFSQAIISEEISGNRFVIQTDKPNIKVSWQVTGIRNDAYAQQNRIEVESRKHNDHLGKYLNPEAFGKSLQQGIDYNHSKEAETERKKLVQNN